MSPRSARRVTLAVPLAIGLIPIVTGCGSGGGSDPLRGHVPHGMAPVRDVVLPEVRPGRSEVPFAIRARSGQLLVVYFGYTSCPDVCPTTLGDLRAALQQLGDDANRVEVAFITVDPARDLPEVLVPYLTSFVPDGHALRPRDQEQLAGAERAFHASSSVERDLAGHVEVSHTPLSYVVDDGGRVLLEWDFGTAPGTIARDLRSLLRATGGRK
ncbi:MAG: SCO family protein [Candidatus Eisenbacteria bacterium]